MWLPCCATATGGYCSFLGEGWVECNNACARCDMWDNADARQSATEGGARFDTYAIELNSPPQGDIVVVPAGTQVSVEPAFGVFTPANWSESMVFTIIADDDHVAELGEVALPVCDVYDGACGAVGMLNCADDCVPVGVAEPDATVGRGPHHGYIRHTIVGDDFVYNSMPIEWVVNVDITDNDFPAVAIRKNLTAMDRSHRAEIIANDYYELRLDGWIAREASYTGALNGGQNPWPESNYHDVTAACDEPTVFSVYAADTDMYPPDNNYGVGGFSAFFEMCEEQYFSNLEDWKCVSVESRDAVEVDWYSPEFDDSSWPNAVEHDLVRMLMVRSGL